MSELYTMKWEVGAHAPFCGVISLTISQAIRYGMYTVQFFMGNNKTAWKRSEISQEDISMSLEFLSRFPLNVFTHYPYCANLAGNINTLAWSGDPSVDGKLKGVIKALEYELGIMAKLSLMKRTGVVIHPGSFPDRTLGHEAVAKTINNINFPEDSVLLLENCAGEGNKLCKTFEEIKYVFDRILKEKKKNVKVCVDTAHIWGQGDYDLRQISEIDRMFTDFDRILGIENFYLLHLNDSEVCIGSKRDAHARLGYGHIWGESFAPLIYLLNKCKSYGIPALLETHGVDMLTLAKLG